jgi:protein tyrosine/serine phosphatase
MTVRRRLPLLASLLFLASLCGCTGFHEVVPGSIYRDRQPTEDELVARVEDYGIKTVVALRGKGSAPARRAALATGITFVALPMSARRLPTAAELLALWQTIATAERPLLFHCRAGVDRTGLAAALAVLHDTDDLQQARSQLALIPYGHLGWFGTGAMDEVLDRYEPWHGTLPFADWVEQIYSRQLAGEDPAAPR